MKYNLQGKFHTECRTFTLVGMSGSGKTALSHKLSADGFFHYSVDYEIAHTHLKEKIRQSVIEKVSKQSPIFADLLSKYAIKLELSLTFDDLAIITMFVIPENQNGKINITEFLCNQELYKEAEIQATAEFQSRANIAFTKYHVEGFIVDATGSICEVALSSNSLLDSIKNHSRVVYLQTTARHKEILVERSKTAIKPILYNRNFLFQNLREFYKQETFPPSFEIDKEFFLWVFPKLLEYRVKLYDDFVKQTNGIIIDVEQIAKIRDGKDFIDLIYGF